MSKAIDDLMHEHEAILFALGILDRMAAAQDLDAGDAGNFLGFLQEFGDKCHHAKEEEILFPALAQAGIPNEGGPIGVMLYEHEQGRGLIRQMSQAVSGAGVDATGFAAAAGQYRTLMQNHIQKENNVLFPMADTVLPQALLEQIFVAFEQHEEAVIGHGRHEELHALLHGLAQKYGA